MRKTTVTEKFDAEGKLIERVTVTEVEQPNRMEFYPWQYVPPSTAPIYPASPPARPFEITWGGNIGGNTQ